MPDSWRCLAADWAVPPERTNPFLSEGPSPDSHAGDTSNPFLAPPSASTEEDMFRSPGWQDLPLPPASIPALTPPPAKAGPRTGGDPFAELTASRNRTGGCLSPVTLCLHVTPGSQGVSKNKKGLCAPATSSCVADYYEQWDPWPLSSIAASDSRQRRCGLSRAHWSVGHNHPGLQCPCDR